MNDKVFSIIMSLLAIFVSALISHLFSRRLQNKHEAFLISQQQNTDDVAKKLKVMEIEAMKEEGRKRRNFIRTGHADIP